MGKGSRPLPEQGACVRLDVLGAEDGPPLLGTVTGYGSLEDTVFVLFEGHSAPLWVHVSWLKET